MKVHLIRKETIERYVEKNARSRSSFADWLTRLKYASWEKPADIQSTFGSSYLLGKSSGRVVFNISGNNHRMSCNILSETDKSTCLFVG